MINHKRLRNYIGLATTGHDPALAIINSQGEIVFAEATERYLQNKRAHFYSPEDVIRLKDVINRYCEKDVDLVVATSWTNKHIYSRKLFNLKPLRYLIEHYCSRNYPNMHLYHLVIASVSNMNPNFGEAIAYNINNLDKKAAIIKKSFDHHYTHAATACYSSPFTEGICAVIDGFGENNKSMAFFSYHDGIINHLPIPVSSDLSLGMLYSDICDTCGFSFLQGEEWKVMGLAAYGKYDDHIYKILKLILDVKDCKLISGKDSKLGQRMLHELKLKPKEDPLNAANLAYTAQIFFCNTVFEILNALYNKKISENLILGGGCLLNSSCNGMILKNTAFKNMHIFSAPADDGNAIGAALLAYYEDHPKPPVRARFQTPYLGEQVSTNVLSNLNKYSNLNKLELKIGESILQKTAELLAQGKIVGWMQGRAEFGPRALGNRSILADPRSAEVKDRLNATVKFREEFRPFAPSILHEYGHEYFEDYQESPYMERTLHFKKEVISKVPGVVHVDGTGRLQTVKREWNEKYYDLIAAFKAITGIPIILNTSFNVMGKPIIHTVEDAVAVFLTSGLDVLVIENYIYLKSY